MISKDFQYLRDRPAPTSTDPMTESGLIITREEGNVTVVQLNRPKKRNALSQALINELIGVLFQLDRSNTVRAVVLTSSEQGPFCGMSSAVPHVLVLIGCSWSRSRRASQDLYSRSFSAWMAEGPE